MNKKYYFAIYLVSILLIISILFICILYQRKNAEKLFIPEDTKILSIEFKLESNTKSLVKGYYKLKYEKHKAFVDELNKTQLIYDYSNANLIGQMIIINQSSDNVLVLEILMKGDSLILKYKDKYYLGTFIQNFIIPNEIMTLNKLKLDEITNIELNVNGPDFSLAEGDYISRSEKLTELINILNKLELTPNDTKLIIFGTLTVNQNSGNVLRFQFGLNRNLNKIILIFEKNYYISSLDFTVFFLKK